MATLKSVLPCFLMVLLQFASGGMSPTVMVAYRQLFATLMHAPLASFFERKSMPTITKCIALQMFLASFFG
ncbi:hypothetical protein MKX01_007695 [Papaver californicum]|nr:hypothetical protein MKX01_007695 [Papaver californicum]